MNTEITLDKQALTELIKDPEVKVKIHDADSMETRYREADEGDKSLFADRFNLANEYMAKQKEEGPEGK